MVASTAVLNPAAPHHNRPREWRRTLEALSGKTIGFIDNGKPNFNYLIEELEPLLKEKYAVKAVMKHRKRGSVPVIESALKELAEHCDAIITGSGD